MANNNTLKSDIRQYIYSNQNEEITGNILRDVLLEMVDTLGDGWTYKGVATTTTNPGTPDDNVFYIATAPGTYTNFSGLSVADGEVAILKYNGSWAKDVTGAATSAQVTQLGREVEDTKDALDEAIYNPNLFAVEDAVDGGFYNASGVWTTNVNFFSSDFIPAVAGDRFKVVWTPTGQGGQGGWCVFKSDKTTWASGGQQNITMNNGSYEITIPASLTNTAYITFGLQMIDKTTVRIYKNGDEYLRLDEDVIVPNVVKFNEAQNLTDTQKAQARANIDAAGEDEVNYVTTNVVNAAADISGWSYGYVRPNGTISQASGGTWKYSDKIPIYPNSTIVIKKLYGAANAVAAVAAYTEADVFVPSCSYTGGSINGGNYPIDTNGSGVAYIRITAGGGYPDYDVEVVQDGGTMTIKEKIAQIEQSGGSGLQWQGKSWVALGTSITDTKNTLAPDGTSTGKFVPFLVALSGLVVTDKGVAGSVIGGHILYYAGHTTETANADIITIEGGVNDWAGSRPLGQVGDTTPYLIEWTSPAWNNGGSADGTFAGACYQAIKTAMDNSPKAVVVVLTDNTGRYIASTGQHCERERQNSLGLLQKDYTDMLIAVAHYMGVPVINAGQRSMINQDNPDYLIDQIHQTELGGEQYANVIWGELKNVPVRIV